MRISVAERQIRELLERNQARAALQESAQTMINILEKTTDGFFAVDSEWKLTYINAEAEVILERKRDELLGGLLWERFPALVGSVFQSNYERVMAEQSRPGIRGERPQRQDLVRCPRVSEQRRRLGFLPRHKRTEKIGNGTTHDEQA